MKNINVYILTAIVSLVMVVATAFLMTAADEPVRQAGMFPDRRQEPLRKSLSAPRRRIPSRPPSNRKLRDRRGSAAENALAQTRLLTYGRLRECARS